MACNFATFQVGMKMLLKRNDEYLFLTDAATGKIDFPGGRINDDEYDVPLEIVIKREIREELGEGLRYELGKPALQYRARAGSENPFVFLTIYEGDYLGGEIQLSAEHTAFRWLDARNADFKKEDFFNTEAYLAFKQYFRATKNDMEFKHTNLKIETEYPKLVRDKIPEIIKKNEGIEIRSRILDDGEFLKYLLKKIVEEAAELQDAADKGNLEEEVADIFEITDNILKLRKKNKEEIFMIQEVKREKNGGFDKRILMIGKDN